MKYKYLYSIWLFSLCTAVLIFIAGCNNGQKYHSFMMPNQEILNFASLNDLSKSFNMKFHQYQGFKVKYNDTVLKEYTFVFNKHWEKVGIDILSDGKIEKLKSEQVIEIKFDKIPTSRMTEVRLLKYLKNKYPNTKVIENNENLEESVDKEFILVSSETGEFVCKIDYMKCGIPGYFVRVL